MEHNQLLERLHREIEKIPCDIKAEALLALALKNGLSMEDFMISCNSFFYREFKKDILSAEIIEDVNRKSLLQLYLTRSGMYDQLPEGLFYQPDKTKSQPSDAAGMAAEYKRNKQKEQEIRRFFTPFENEIFLQRLQLEMEEARLLQGFQSRILNEYFINFWGISRNIDESFVIPLIRLLPYAHKIAGDPDLTCHSLQLILNEQVSVRKLTAWITVAQQNNMYELGKQQLGIDMVSGEQFMEDHTIIEFTIGPLKNSQVTDYLEGGSKEEFLKTFYSFFIPVEAEVITMINVASRNRFMVLQSVEEPVLGYTSTL
jgi:hypothetical protein